MNIGFIFALLSATFYSIDNILLKFLGEVDPKEVPFWRNLFFLLLLSPFVNLSTFRIEYLYLIGIGLIGFVPYYLFVKGIQKFKAGPFVTFTSTYGLIASLLGWLILKEAVTIYLFAGLLLVTSGIVILNFEKTELTKNFIVYSLTISFFWGFYMLLFKFIKGLGFLEIIYFSELGIFIASLFFVKFPPKIYRKVTYVKLLFLALAIVFGDLFFIKAINSTTLGYTSLGLISSPIITTILAFIILREKLTERELISIIVTFIGIAIASM